MFQLERLGAEDFLISQEVSSPTNLFGWTQLLETPFVLKHCSCS